MFLSGLEGILKNDFRVNKLKFLLSQLTNNDYELRVELESALNTGGDRIALITGSLGNRALKTISPSQLGYFIQPPTGHRRGLEIAYADATHVSVAEGVAEVSGQLVTRTAAQAAVNVDCGGAIALLPGGTGSLFVWLSSTGTSSVTTSPTGGSGRLIGAFLSVASAIQNFVQHPDLVYELKGDTTSQSHAITNSLALYPLSGIPSGILVKASCIFSSGLAAQGGENATNFDSPGTGRGTPSSSYSGSSTFEGDGGTWYTTTFSSSTVTKKDIYTSTSQFEAIRSSRGYAAASLPTSRVISYTLPGL
jgi:hypothetical protein